MSGALRAVLMRDLKLAFRAGGAAGLGVVFFLALITVVPFAVGPDLPLLARIGPAMVWLGALLATLLNLDRIFSADRDDGSLDLLLMSPAPLELIAAAKGLAHWLATGLPLVIAAPVLGVMLGVPADALLALCLTLLIGTPALTFLGLIGAALAAMLPRGGLLVAVLVLPFTIPVLIFGTATTAAAVSGPAGAFMSFGVPFRLLAALSLLSLIAGPLAAAAAIRQLRD